jgi:hypothetical protein
VTATLLVACGDDDASQPTATLSDDTAVAFCQLMEQSDDLEPDGGETPDELRAKLDEFRPLLLRIAERAPDEIHAEVEDSVAAYSRLIDLTAGADYNLDQVDAATVSELSGEIDANGDVIQAWLESNCG